MLKTLGSSLFKLARAADANVTGVAVLKPAKERPAEPGWFVVLRPDGVRLRIDTTDGRNPNAAAVAAVTNADVSDAAEAARIEAAFPERFVLRQVAANAVADINTYLANADTGTPAQISARDHQATKRLAQIVKALILRTVQID